MIEATVSFAGNLTDDPELRHTEGGIARAMFRVAVSGRREQEASFFTVVVWRDQAEHAAESLTKGSRVVVVGRLQQRTWTTEDGSARSVVEVLADELGPSLRWRRRPRPVRRGVSRLSRFAHEVVAQHILVGPTSVCWGGQIVPRLVGGRSNDDQPAAGGHPAGSGCGDQSGHLPAPTEYPDRGTADRAWIGPDRWRRDRPHRRQHDWRPGWRHRLLHQRHAQSRDQYRLRSAARRRWAPRAGAASQAEGAHDRRETGQHRPILPRGRGWHGVEPHDVRALHPGACPDCRERASPPPARHRRADHPCQRASTHEALGGDVPVGA
jgi:single-strand DNA-binding protein